LNCSSPLFDKWIAWLRTLLGARRFNPDTLIASMELELNRRPTTQADLLFYHMYRSDFVSIFESVRQFRQIPPSSWRDVEAFQSQVEQISLPYFAPALAKLTDSLLAVPGTYEVGVAPIRISHFLPYVNIAARQHRLVVVGNDGNEYEFLLKCQSDLRLDQHVMQYFELMSNHIKNRFPKDRRDLTIPCYSITPLSQTTGLMPNIIGAESMESMIRSYRTKMKREDPELVLSETSFLTDLDSLTHLQRLEFHQDATATIPDDDLREAVWLRSGSSQAWLVKTLRFVRTAAIASVVGYIVALGDRRPLNVLVRTLSGDAVHIDFGASFVAEDAVPFRLTRMMVAAFGVAGREGEFRLTAELMMKNVRDHRQSGMAALGILRHRGSRDARGEEGSREVDAGEVLARIERKLVGMHEETGQMLSVEKQVDALIAGASDPYSLAKMPADWSPLW
jgi:FKBP12-rapamycin complex-associated protein